MAPPTAGECPDRFSFSYGRMNLPLSHAFDITPSDDDFLPARTRVIFVGVTGHLKVQMEDDSIVTLFNHPTGYADLRIVKVFATDTTAQNIVGFW